MRNSDIKPTWATYAAAVVAVAVAVAVRLLLDPMLGVRFPFATVFFAVLATAWFGGRGPALCAVILGAVASAWFLLPPRHSWALDTLDNVGGLILYLAVGTGIALLGGLMHSAQRRAETAAAESDLQREQLRVTLHSIGDAVISTDTAGRVKGMNSVAEELTGWKLSEAQERPLEQVFHIINEQTRQVVESPVRKVLDEGIVVGLANHTLLIAKDGSSRPIDDSAAPIRDAQGQLLGVVLVFRDVADRRSSEIKLRQSEQDLTDFFENASVGLHWVGPDGTILRVNRAELKLLGYEHDEYVGRKIAEFHVDQDVIADILRRLTAGETLENVPARLRCKDGSIKEVIISSSVLRHEGKFIHTRCFTVDVTEQNRARETSSLLAAIVESSDDAIVTKTLEGVVTSWNGGAERLFGYRSEEIIGKPITVLIPDELYSEEQEILARLARGERIKHFDTIRRAKDGRLLDISLTISPIRGADGRVIGASKVARDITERKRSELALKASEEALRHADRRKDEFLATLAHELRNPLAPVRNSLEIMKRSREPELIEQARATMDRQMSHLERLVDDLLDISRITRDTLELRKQQVELASVVHQAVETSRPLAVELGHEVIVDLPDEPIYLRADPIRLAQVFSNLLNNACKYTERGGKICLTARREGQQLVLRVKDNGIGIPADMLPHIFQMFTQVPQSIHRSQGGLGIGLTLVRRLVEMHEGSVAALSEGAGKGSEFVIRLPILQLAAETKLSSKPAPDKAGPRRRVLVVDDNQDAAMTLAMLLKISGHEVATAHDGEAAVEVAGQMRPDVVLLDIGLPKISGYEAAKRIRSQPWGVDMMLIAATGWGQEEDRRKSDEAGFNHHLVKPVDFTALKAVLASMSEGAS